MKLLLNQGTLEYILPKAFGGGVRGSILKSKLLELCCVAAEQARKSEKEFYVFRTGGISCFQDIIESYRAGVSMNKIYTGFMEGYAEKGGMFLKSLFEEYQKNI